MKKFMIFIVLTFIGVMPVFSQNRIANTSWIRNNGVIFQRITLRNNNTAQLYVQFIQNQSVIVDEYQYIVVYRDDGIPVIFLRGVNQEPFYYDGKDYLIRPSDVRLCITDTLYMMDLFGKWQEFRREK